MIYLKEVSINDAEDLFLIAKNDNVTKYLTWQSHKDINQTKDVINNFYLTKVNSNLPNSFGIYLDDLDKIIGIIDFYLEDNYPYVGYFLDENYWHKGIMTEALNKILDIGFNKLNFPVIRISHFEENIGSMRVILKNNFKFINKIVKDDNKTTLVYELKKGDFNDK